MKFGLLSFLLLFITVLLLSPGECTRKENVLKVLHKGREAYDKLVVSVRYGATMGLHQCRAHFRHQKWNCTIAFNPERLDILPVFMLSSIPHATRETAFVHSISAAGVTYALTKDCRLGKFEDCSCIHKRQQQGKGKWWGGCSENVKFGEVMAKHFLEALEKGKDERTLLNIHNNEVGRKAVRATLRRECRCHGITGSCSTRSCWRKLSSFTEVGQYLKKKYQNAKRVRFTKDKFMEETPLGLTPLNRKDLSLIYTELSPDYCHRNMTVGAAGVLGRECQGDNKVLEKCHKLCSSCGLRTEEFTVTQEVFCNCKFQWCCKVKCATCQKSVLTTRCVSQ